MSKKILTREQYKQPVMPFRMNLPDQEQTQRLEARLSRCKHYRKMMRAAVKIKPSERSRFGKGSRTQTTL